MKLQLLPREASPTLAPVLVACLYASSVATAGIPVALPPSEATDDWQEALDLAGLAIGGSLDVTDDEPSVAVVEGGAGVWHVRISDSAGEVREVSVAAPQDDGEREDLGWLVASLVESLGPSGTWVVPDQPVYVTEEPVAVAMADPAPVRPAEPTQRPAGTSREQPGGDASEIPSEGVADIAVEEPAPQARQGLVIPWAPVAFREDSGSTLVPIGWQSTAMVAIPDPVLEEPPGPPSWVTVGIGVDMHPRGITAVVNSVGGGIQVGDTRLGGLFAARAHRQSEVTNEKVTAGFDSGVSAAWAPRARVHPVLGGSLAAAMRWRYDDTIDGVPLLVTPVGTLNAGCGVLVSPRTEIDLRVLLQADLVELPQRIGEGPDLPWPVQVGLQIGMTYSLEDRRKHFGDPSSGTTRVAQKD